MKNKILSLILTFVTLLSATSIINVDAAGLSIDEAEEIVLDKKYTDTIEHSANKNWYKFTADETAYYIITYNRGDSFQQVLDLCNDMGKVLDKTYWASEVDTLTVKLEENETIYMKVRLTVQPYSDEEMYEPVPYSFIVRMSEDEDGVSFDEPTIIKLNQKEVYTFGGDNDEDYFVFYGKKENNYKFALEDISGTRESKKIEVFDSKISKIKTIYGGQNFSANGYDTYYIKATFSPDFYYGIDFEEPHEYSIRITCESEETEEVENDYYYDDTELEEEEEEPFTPQQLDTPVLRESTPLRIKVGESPKFSWYEVENADYYTVWDWARNQPYDNIKGTSFDNIPPYTEPGTYAIGVYARSKTRDKYPQSETFSFNVIVEPAENSFSPTPQQGDIKVVVDGSYVNFDVPPQIINGRTMIPVRAVAEALDAEVSWYPELQSAVIEKDPFWIKLKIGNTRMEVAFPASVYSKYVELDSAPVIINDRTLLPIRAICEAMYCDVEWDDSTKTVYITKWSEFE